MSKEGLLIIQLGSPKSPAVKDVKDYLWHFLSDPRVVDTNPRLWKIILKLFVLPSRSPKSAAAYAEIWDGETFPLLKHTKAFADEVRKSIVDSDYELEHSYILSKPSVGDSIKKLYDRGCRKIRVIPMYPQFSEATTYSCKDAMDAALENYSDLTCELVESWYEAPAYIENSVAMVRKTLENNQDIEKLLLSFHGYPIRRIRKGDSYFDECQETAKLFKKSLPEYADRIEVTFQSRFGREPWLIPGTEETIIELAEKGIKKIAVACPAFVVDNLETLEEVGLGLKEVFLENGGDQFVLVPSLNSDKKWAADFTRDVLIPEKNDKGERVIPSMPSASDCELKVLDQGCCHAAEHCPTCPYKGQEKHADGSLSPRDRSVLKTMFFTLFLDLIGFSIMFPLFPQMLDYYREAEQGAPGLFTSMMEFITNIVGASKGDSKAVTALFGGFLIFIYSFLQFLMAPFFGTVSDKVGRRPVLLVSITGIAISYLIWFFSGSFLLLVISRILSGVMGSNISTATAAVADVTSSKTRSRGMAYIGIAFGLGFIIGPALGGILVSLWDPSTVGNLADYGVNPFSLPAAFAFVLSLFNLLYVFKKFPETLPQELRGKGKVARTINPLKIMHVGDYPEVKRIVWSYFLFLAAFAGAETVLTFLTVERLGYTELSNGLLFVYIGFIISMVQGGYVRRKAGEIGESVMSKKGLIYLIPGLLFIALSGYLKMQFFLFVGLFLMATGSAMVTPCLTALTSMYTPDHDQGRVLGIFRSLGAFSRTIGPLIAGVLYWKFGYSAPFIAAGIFMIVPFFMIKRLANPAKK